MAKEIIYQKNWAIIFFCISATFHVTGFGQPDPKRPDLCQGAYYTEKQAAQVLQDLTKTYYVQRRGKKGRH